MPDFKYLKDEQYYIDRYDIQTVIECLKLYWDIRKGIEAKRNQVKNMTQKKFDEDVHKTASYAVRAFSAERYKHKAETIQKWIDQDRKTQEKYDNAKSSEDILCKECSSPTKVVSKDLLDTLDENSQVLFMYECTKCKSCQAFYEDGTEWKYKPPLCPKCSSPFNSNSRDRDGVSLTIYTCPNCSFTEKSVYDFKASEKERKERETRERKLLAEYRDEFCLSEETGQQALMDYEQLRRATEYFREKEAKDKDPLFQKARKLKSLKVLQLKELIEKNIEDKEYADLQFGKPEIDQFVIIDFTVNDTKDGRHEYDSSNELKKLIKAALENTNWRLMSEGISYRLGILSGRLKAYEREEDLVKLVDLKNKEG